MEYTETVTEYVTGINSTWINSTIMKNTGINNTINATTEPIFVPDPDMIFNSAHVVSIVTYSFLIIISAIGNFTVLILIRKRKGKTRSRMNTMLMHLAIADLLVTFIIMPMELVWACTVSWEAGDVMCRIMMFFRMFGIYLSCFILVCISVDRYYAVLKPLHLMDVDRRGKVMLIIAWGASTLCSLPQMVVFHVEIHPNMSTFQQCVTFNAFPTRTHELMYALFGMVMMYPIPLFIIIYSYASIIAEIYKRSRESFSDKIRRSSLGFLGRAKIRTLKMTIIIILAFFACWTPYYVLSFWWVVDEESFQKLDQRIRRGLFLFACTNSCMNPIVYGAFNIRSRKRDAAGTSQRVASSTSRGVLQSATPDVVCRVSWRRTLNDSHIQHSKKNSVPRENLELFSKNNTEKVATQDTQNLTTNDNGQQQITSEIGRPNCFTITPPPRTTVL